MAEITYNVKVTMPATKLSVTSDTPRVQTVRVTGTQGTDGINGKSAYEIALDEGFNGTRNEWIESLRGSSAYQIALDNGFVGTEDEWLESLRFQVKPEDATKILTNNGSVVQWVTLDNKLNESQINWDFGEI